MYPTINKVSKKKKKKKKDTGNDDDDDDDTFDLYEDEDHIVNGKPILILGEVRSNTIFHGVFI